MPGLALHTAIAKEMADHLRRRTLDEERGSLYLGSTAPDIHIITRWERECTHFFDLANFEEQSGVAGLFRAYPCLVRPATLNRPTAAFVAGYITHLVTDEIWINTIYRPFFGERSPLAGSLRANIMDRAMQFSMDRERRSDRKLMAHVLAEVARCDLALEIDFVDGEMLRRWQEVLLEVVRQLPDWERFRYVAGRHLREAGIESVQAFQDFVRSLPDLVNETLVYLTPERVQAFTQDSLNRSLEAVKEYLVCA